MEYNKAMTTWFQKGNLITEKRLLFVILFFLSGTVYGQTPFSIKISFEQEMSDYVISGNYDNGIGIVNIEDTTIKDNIDLRGVSYSKIINFLLILKDKKTNKEYSSSFLCSSSDGYLVMQIRPKLLDSFFIVTKSNNIVEFDFGKIKFLKQMQSYSITESEIFESYLNSLKENIDWGNDKKLKEAFISMFRKRSDFLNMHNQDDYSFWYFRNQIVGSLTTLFKRDTAIGNFLCQVYEKAFSLRYDSTIEGRTLRNKLFRKEYLELNTALPKFKIKSMTSDTIDDSSFKGKIIIIDFWASWCPPCIKKIPLLQNIRKDYDTSKLVILGINLDYTLDAAKKAIKQYQINWSNYFDELHELRNLFSIDAIPVLIVVDKDKRIIYNSQLGDNEATLTRLLETKLKTEEFKKTIFFKSKDHEPE